MSSVRSSYFRRLIYAAPGLIIIGGIIMIFDVEYGGAVLGAGVVGLIIGIITVVRSRQANQRQAQGYSPVVQQAETYQSTAQQPLHQPVQQEPQNQPVEQQTTSEPKPKFCTNCGGKIDDTMTACAHCGSNL
ncbi:MAG: hypothetical protein KAU62_09090 [Candidatus Heimdallarchaeota archaeon]|nr:hypothetical protein [Candidatus Heimdallarchaeota archaeon]MCG3256225.1 hypothetical protein [Candidatus Heimdallarchaeota archaeon]MCK4611294.1 hypothetical protein [Candidatus Heimdallarchaeota archaeon]